MYVYRHDIIKMPHFYVGILVMSCPFMYPNFLPNLPTTTHGLHVIIFRWQFWKNVSGAKASSITILSITYRLVC
jgi:hypothetical protein